MSRAWLSVLAALLGLLVRPASGGEAPAFTAGPAARAAGNDVEITFAVSAPTDVEVAVVDERGEVLRHLAAGLLGGKAPPPEPLKAGLNQSVLWDRKDDDGKPVTAAGLKVRVGLGLGAKFDKVLGWDGPSLPIPPGTLGVDSAGLLYAACIPDGWPWKVHHFDVLGRDGKYVRSLMPYPAELPREKLKGFGILEMPGGKFLPAVRNSGSWWLCPESVYCRDVVALPDGVLALANTRGLVFVGADGSAPPDGVKGPEFPAAVQNWRPPCLAASPDGRFVYVSGLRAGDGNSPKAHHPVILRANRASGAMDVFVGEMGKSGVDDKHLNAPQGLAVDEKGLLWVADNGNNRVCVFSPDGALVAKLEVEAPFAIGLHKSGALYVMCFSAEEVGRAAKVPRRLVKLEGAVKAVESAGKVQAVKLLDIDSSHYPPAMAVDAAAEPPVIWIGDWRYGGWGLNRIEDRPGGRPEIRTVPDNRGQALYAPLWMSVDPEDRAVYVVNATRFQDAQLCTKIEVATGRCSPLTKEGVCDVAAAPDGSVYVWGVGNFYGPPAKTVRKYGPDGKPAPLAGSTATEFKTEPWMEHKGGWVGTPGFGVDGKGDIYFMRGIAGMPHYHAVDIYGPDGKCKKRNVFYAGMAARQFYEGDLKDVFNPDGTAKIGRDVPPYLQGYNWQGFSVDRWGNLYVGYNLKTRDMPAEDPAVAAQVAAVFGKPKTASGAAAAYGDPHRSVWGSLFKFGPQGGFIGSAFGPSAYGKLDPGAVAELKAELAKKGIPVGGPVPEEQYLHPDGNQARVWGALWQYRGMSPCYSGRLGECVCISPRVGIDDFGRVFLPDALRCRVTVLDAGGSVLAHFGEYGNMRCQAPGMEKIKGFEEAIPLAQPLCVRPSKKAIYVSDKLNRRVLRVLLTHAVEKTCTVP